MIELNTGYTYNNKMINKDVKKQHYIAELFLWYFVNQDKKLFEVLLNEKKIYPATPSNSMCEMYTYEHKKLSTNTIENYFNRIETRIAPLLENIIIAIEKIEKEGGDLFIIKNLIEDLLTDFLVFYYRSGALLTEFSSINTEDKIPLLSEKILDYDYINKLALSIKKFYKFAIIKSSGDFLLSDQFISTSALRVKSQFFDISNRNIGLNETLILIPISSSYYIVYWDTKYDFLCKKDSINILSEENIKLFNYTIINNSYKKCIAQKKERLEEVLSEYRAVSVMHVMAGGGEDGHFMGAIKKKEVFFYSEERDVYQLLELATFTIYRDLCTYDMCACKSGKKFRWCHMNAYIRVQKIIKTFGNQDIDTWKSFLIQGIPVIERPIDKWSGYDKK